MDSIIHFTDYRLYMQQWFMEKKKNSAMNWREFARIAGFKSPVYLKLVCDGKSTLRGAGILRVASAMGLDGFELAYFRAMVGYAHSKRENTRQRYLDEMRALAKVHKVKVLKGKTMTYFESWLNPVLRELVPHMQGARPKQIAINCIPKVSAKEVSETIHRLVEWNLLKKMGKDTYVQTDNTISTGNMDFVPTAMQQMHLQMGNLALKAIKDIPLSQRSVSGLTLGLTEKAFQKIVKELSEFRRKVIAIATEDSGMDQVYRLNLQLFPLTHKRSSKK